jgi:hypothetical protein
MVKMMGNPSLQPRFNNIAGHRGGKLVQDDKRCSTLRG